MRLQSAHITKYKNINDSTQFILEDDITAFVGKNASGKTAALEALYRVNPLSSGHPTAFEELWDYPRRHRARDKGRIAQARPVTATFELEQDDLDAVAKAFGPEAFTAKTITVHRRYDDNT
jgi:recombinational DNA repair ATPase RecF